MKPQTFIEQPRMRHFENSCSAATLGIDTTHCVIPFEVFSNKNALHEFRALVMNHH